MLKVKDQEHKRKCSQKKVVFFSGDLKRGKQIRSSQIFLKVSGVFQQNFNSSKNSAVLEPRTGQFSRI